MASSKTSSQSCRGSASCSSSPATPASNTRARRSMSARSGANLGVRYVLEGSVRRGGDRIRISAQLIEPRQGAHRWAEHYDRKLEDVFAVQDEVVRTIVAILAAHVRKAETERTRAKPPNSWQAYDYYLQAVEAFASFHRHTA